MAVVAVTLIGLLGGIGRRDRASSSTMSAAVSGCLVAMSKVVRIQVEGDSSGRNKTNDGVATTGCGIYLVVRFCG